ncbi:hypothetical protein ACHAWF_011964 [Thalassiosira exigua]
MGSVLGKVLARPKVKVTKIKVRGISPRSGELTAEVTLSIVNPNPVTIRAKSFHYRVTKKSNGRSLADGRGESFEARGHGHATEVVTPVHLKLAGVGSASKSLLLKGRIHVVISGSMDFDAPMTMSGVVTVPFHGEEMVVTVK